ncbi:MAG TPA: hypothetical protein VGE04_08490 [Chloroflexia bacterium]|jgi:hypothetical protein
MERAIARTVAVERGHFEQTLHTVFDDGSIVTTRAEWDYIKSPYAVRGLHHDGTGTFENLVLGNSFYIRDEDGTWLRQPHPLEHVRARLSDEVRAALPEDLESIAPTEEATIPVWEETNLADYQFATMDDEVVNGTRAVHVVGKTTERDASLLSKTLSLWIDPATEYLLKFSTVTEIDVAPQLQPWAVNVSYDPPTGEPPAWKPVKQLITIVTLSRLDDPGITVPSP